MIGLPIKKLVIGTLAVAVPFLGGAPAFAASAPNSPAISHTHAAQGPRLIILGYGNGPTPRSAIEAAHQDAVNQLTQAEQQNNVTCIEDAEAFSVATAGPFGFNAEDHLTADCTVGQ